MKLSCAVIGGKGFVGSAVAAEAERRGHVVVIIDLDNYDQFAGRSYDLLINANGNSKKFLAREDPRREFDLSVRSVMRALHDFRAGLYVHLSSIDVYNNVSDPVANAEDVVIDPARLSPYGFHKLMAEEMVRYYAPRWLILRMGGFVGPRLWKNSIHDLLKGAPLRVHPDSEYQYLYTRDLAAAALDLAASGREHEVFNVAGDGVMSLREAAVLVPGYDCAALPEDLPRERYEVNIGKLQAERAMPCTRDTVAAFIGDVLAGREVIS
ncbi:MAG: NAD(P)-dependent oxidoreductase [Kiritimatiellae bacterium]|nr:NAD(P)-dependent oxidoreductase [Kiritimatiellia bacterium]